MRRSQSAIRYAKSLVSLAKEKGLLEDIKNDATLITKTIAENSELGNLMDSPIVKADKKQAIFKAIFDGKVNEMSVLFFNLLANNGRESITDLVFDKVLELYRKEKNIVKANIKSAVALDDATVAKLQDKIKAACNGATLEIESHIDSELIGGFVVRIEDNQVDASIASSLNKLKLELQA